MVEPDAVKEGRQSPLWIETIPKTSYPVLREGVEVDVVIVGGGMAGLSAAYFLKQEGKKVAVLEANRIARGVTGRTTAKITALHGFKYEKLLKNYPKDIVNLYCKANEAGLEKTAQLIKNNNIKCDFKRQRAYSYTEDRARLDAVKSMVEGMNEAGIRVDFTTETDLPFNIAGAAVMENQAQFHPGKYLLALAEIVDGEDSFVFEQTMALDIKVGRNPYEVQTDKGVIRGEKVVMATHFPFKDNELFFGRMYPNRSYALGLQIDGRLPDGMYLSYDGPHYTIRNQEGEEGRYLIAGGGHHPNGRGGNTLKHYEESLRYARERFKVKSVGYHWSTMDYMTADFLPFIGKTTLTRGIYTAAGFDKWGIAFGTFSGMLLTDLIMKRDNPWKNLFKPTRLNFTASIGNLVTEGFNNSREYLKGYLTRRPQGNPADFKNNEAKVVKFNGRGTAAYKDADGNTHAVSATCTHLFCKVNWNKAEHTWDCPCHGSVFGKDGQIFHGPAKKKLKDFGERVKGSQKDKKRP